MKWLTGTSIAAVGALLFVSATAPAATVVYTFTGGGAINPSGITPVTFVPFTGWTVESVTSFPGQSPVNVIDNNVGSGYQLTAPLAGNGVDISSYAPFDATYSGSITVVDGVATSGTLSWTGELGFEPSVAPGETPGTGLYTVLLLNGSWNLASGALAGTTVVACRAKPGLAGAACIGPYNTALSNYDMPLGVSGFVDNGNGTVTFMLGSDDFTNAGGVHNMFDPSLGSPDFNHRVTFTLNAAPDTDGDSVADASDNCRLVSNPTQLDANADGYGNICDADINNSGTVTTADFGLLRSVLGQAATFSATAAAADMNGSGTVTTADFGLLRARLGTAPGPSGLACAGTIPCPP